jgi:hypothetical protein
MSSADFNPYAAPLSDLVPEIVNEGIALWRDGQLLVVRQESNFPDVCVKCNAPANGWQLKRTLYWHHPAWYLLLVFALLFCGFGLIIYAAVALIVRRKMAVRFGLCPQHVRARRRALAVTALLVIGGFGLIFAGVTWIGREPFLVMPWCGVGLLLVSVLFGFLVVPTLAPKRIDGLYAKLRGAGNDFLAPLPVWDGP